VFGWKALYWIGSLSFVLLPFLHAQLPESPKFLMLRNRPEEIRRLLGRLRPDRAAARPAQTVNPVAVLLSAKYRRTTLSIWLSAFLSLFCIFGLTGWIPTVMMQRGETFSASFAFGAVMQVMSFLGGLAVGHLIDRFGRSRGLLAFWWAIGGLSVLALITYNAHAMNLAAVALAGFCIIGAQFVLNNFTANSYETDVRATAVGMELSVARVGAILGPLVAGLLQQTYQSPTPMFLAIGLAALLAGAIILCAARPASEWTGAAADSGARREGTAALTDRVASNAPLQGA